MKNKLTYHDWIRFTGKKVFDLKHIGTLKSVYLCDDGVYLNFENYEEYYPIPAEYCKPILRRIEDMTVEEKDEFVKICYDIGDYILIQDYNKFSNNYMLCRNDVVVVDWLELKGFDLRGWIDAGLAIDAKEVK